MPLIRIQKEKGIKHIFIAGEGIGDLATVELMPGERQVKMGATGDEHLAAGVTRGSAVSGNLVRVITQGIVSGVKTAQVVNAGDRLALATSGAVTPLNSIAVNISGGGLVSGIQAASGIISGWAQAVVSGYFNTGQVLGKALTSGLSGLGISMLVTLG